MSHIILGQDEKIIKVVRKHWMVFAIPAVGTFFLILLPLVAIGLISNIPFIDFNGGGFLLFIFFASIWTLFCWMLFFIVWTNNYLDMLIITDRRIIDVEQIGFFRREMSTFNLERIQDITVETHGVLPTALGFGNLFIQTAGENKEVRLNNVPHVEKTRLIITEAINKHKIDIGL